MIQFWLVHLNLDFRFKGKNLASRGLMLQEKCWLWKQRVYPGYGLLVYHVILVFWHPSKPSRKYNSYNVLKQWSFICQKETEYSVFRSHSIWSEMSYVHPDISDEDALRLSLQRHEAWSLGMGEGNKNSILFRSWCHQKWRLAQIATESFGKDITTAVTAALRYIFW